jgi:hypothetical protein
MSEQDAQAAEASAIQSDLDLHELTEESEEGPSVSRWLLLSGNRHLVTLLLLGVVFATLVAGANVWPLKMRNLLNETNTLQMLFNTLLSGIILLVSVVVSINSIALSQELGSLGTQFERVEQSVTFRSELEDISEKEVSPSRADHFLAFVLETLHERALILRELTREHSDRDLRSRVETLVTATDQDLHAVADQLSQLNLERPNVLLAGLEYDYSTQLYAVRILRTYYGEDMTEDQRQAFDEFAEALNFFAASREYFKTLFYKRELAALSSTLLYVSLPTIVFTAYVLLALDSGMFPELTLFGLPLLLLYISLAFTVALAPFLVLTAYVIRSAFVARRSLEIGPFMAQPDMSKPDLEWEE